MVNDLISVIIPVHNRERFLHRCIDSVLDQKGVNLEIILIDDGSVDSSSSICDEYDLKYENVTVIHQENRGLSAARNLGLDKSSGGFIAFVDDDDFLPDGCLGALLRLLKQYDADLVFGNYSEYTEDGTYHKTFKIPNQYCNKLLGHREICEFFNYSDKTHALVVVWGKLYKKDIWKTLRFPEDKSCSEDQFIFEGLMERCKKIYFTDEVVYNQTLTKNSLVRCAFSRNSLYRSEGIYVVGQYMVDNAYYDIALFKFGLGTRHLILMDKILKDEESRKEIKRQYELYKSLARELIPYVSKKNKLRLILFFTNLRIYGIIRDTFRKNDMVRENG